MQFTKGRTEWTICKRCSLLRPVCRQISYTFQNLFSHMVFMPKQVTLQPPQENWTLKIPKVCGPASLSAFSPSMCVIQTTDTPPACIYILRSLQL